MAHNLLPLAHACQLYGIRMPVNQAMLAGLLGRLLEDFGATSVWIASAATCEACAYWQGGCLRRRTLTKRKACEKFVPHKDALVIVVQTGEVEQ